MLGGGGTVGFVCTGKVAHVDDLRNGGMGVELGIGGGEDCGFETCSVHACVHFEPDSGGIVPVVGKEGGQLPWGLDDGPEAVLVDEWVFLGFESAFEQDDGLGDVGLAQLDGFFEGGNGKTVCQVGQGLCAGDSTVAVGIGFDHGQQAAAVLGFEQAVVVAQVGEADGGG